MELYLVYGSPNCRKPQAVVHNLGLPVTMKPLDFFAGELGTPEYGVINPNRLVPSLTDGALKLWESNAICQYLARGTALFPDEPAASADITRWQLWEGIHYNKATGVMVFENFLKPAFGMGETDVLAVEKATEQFHRFASVLETHLEGREFLVGEGPTIADFSTGSASAFLAPARVPLDGYPNIKAWYARLEGVPGWAESAPPGMEELGRKPATG